MVGLEHCWWSLSSLGQSGSSGLGGFGSSSSSSSSLFNNKSAPSGLFIVR